MNTILDLVYTTLESDCETPVQISLDINTWEWILYLGDYEYREVNAFDEILGLDWDDVYSWGMDKARELGWINEDGELIAEVQ